MLKSKFYMCFYLFILICLIFLNWDFRCYVYNKFEMFLQSILLKFIVEYDFNLIQFFLKNVYVIIYLNKIIFVKFVWNDDIYNIVIFLLFIVCYNLINVLLQKCLFCKIY